MPPSSGPTGVPRTPDRRPASIATFTLGEHSLAGGVGGRHSNRLTGRWIANLAAIVGRMDPKSAVRAGLAPPESGRRFRSVCPAARRKADAADRDHRPKAAGPLSTSFAEMQTVCIYQYEQRQTGQRPRLDAARQPCGKVGVGVTPRAPDGVDAVAAALPAPQSRAGPRASAGARPSAAADVTEKTSRPENG